jgi:hypothetical protein
MKFEKLFNLVTEAGFRPSAPKNMGGARVYAAQQSTGPAGVGSSSVGRNDNPELQTPIKRWEFDPSVDTDKGGVKKEAKAWRTLFNSFSLLSNDKNFQDEIKTISKTFDKRRDSYKNILWGETDLGYKFFTKYDEESRVNTLPATIDKQLGLRSDYETKIAKMQAAINYSKLGPSAIFALEKDIATITAKVNIIEKELKKEMPNHRREKLQKELFRVNSKLVKYEEKLNFINDKKGASYKKSEIFDYMEKIKELDKKIQKNQEELKTVTDRTTKIQSNNEENNNIAIEQFKKQVVSSAEKIKVALGEEIKELQMTEDEGLEDVDDVMEVDWSNIPKNFKTKVKMLDALASTDPAVNPIFGYIDSFDNWYYEIGDDGAKSRVKDLDSREFNPQLNITKIRDYMSLPFVRLMSIYSSASIPKMSVKKEADLKRHENSYTNFSEYIKQFPNSRDPNVIKQTEKAWNDEDTKDMLRSFIASMAIENKDTQYKAINQRFGVTRSGFNSFQQLKSMIDSDMKRFYPKEESFDKIFEKLINEKVWDEDDFKLDTMEVLSYYK